MKHIKKFGEQLNEDKSEMSNMRLDDFYKEYKKLFTNEEEYEQGDEPSNVDLLSSIGDLLNEYDMSNEDIKEILDNYDCKFDINNLLKHEYKYQQNASLISKYSKHPKREKLIELIQGYLGMKPKDKGCKDWNEMQEKMADEIIKIIN